MIDLESTIKNYIENYYTDSELIQLAKPVDVLTTNDSTSTDLDYQTICSKILELLNNSHLAKKYRIEIGKDCSSLIKGLFDTYVKEDTFIVTSNNDHQAVTSLLGDNKRHVFINLDTVNKPEKVISDIITEFKESKCKNLFCIVAGTAPQTAITIPQEFFIRLKKTLLQESIEHLMILDNCQGLFMIERNYEVFDAFLGTGHILSPLFSKLGLLFTKLPQQIGYINKQTLNNIYPKLYIINDHKDKAAQFNALLSAYFNSTLENTDFKQFKAEAPHQFTISLLNTINDPKYDNKFMYYGMRFNPLDCKDNFVGIRYHETIIQDPNYFIAGLKELKKHISKLYRFKEMMTNNPTYTQTSRVKDQKFDAKIHLNPKIEGLLTLDQQKLIYERFLNSTWARSK